MIMRFHLAPFYLFLDDLKRSNQHHIFLMGCILKTVQYKHIVTIIHACMIKSAKP